MGPCRCLITCTAALDVTLRIEHVRSGDLARPVADAVVALCDAAYAEPTQAYFRDIGPGEHLLGWNDHRLVTHLMWVPRSLVIDRGRPLRTAYIEMVATLPECQGQRLASQLLTELPSHLAGCEIAALSPATEGIYRRHGWRKWEGPLFHRLDGHVIPDPEEQVMILELPGTPRVTDWRAPISVEWRPGEIW